MMMVFVKYGDKPMEAVINWSWIILAEPGITNFRMAPNMKMLKHGHLI